MTIVGFDVGAWELVFTFAAGIAVGAYGMLFV
jgi:hypothetical protein